MPTPDDPHLAPLGWVTACAAQVEEIAVALYGLFRDAHDPAVGRAEVSKLPVSQVLEKIERLAKDVDDARAVERFLAESRPALDARNRVVHSTWRTIHDHLTGENSLMRRRLDKRTAGWDVDRAVDIADIEQVADQLQLAAAFGNSAWIIIAQRKRRH